MVTISGYQKRQNAEKGTEFFCLELQGDVEFVKSKTTSRHYLTCFKGSITSTFNESTCKALVGRSLPGKIQRVESEPYDYTIPETGEVVTLTHKYQFTPEQAQTMEQVVFAPESIAVTA